MGQKDVDLVRELYEEFNRHGIEALYKWLAPDVVWSSPPNSADHRVFHGHDGVATWFSDYLYPQFESITFEPEELVDLGDRVVASCRASVRTRESGHELEVPIAHLAELRGGKIVSFAIFSSREQALEAATEGR